MRNGSQARKGATRCASLLFALIIALTSVLPGGLLTASAAAVGLGDLNGDSVINGAATYEMLDTGGNNKAVGGEKTNAAFTYEADLTYVEGNTASLIFGAGANDPALIGREGDTTDGFFGLEFSRTGEGTANINLKLFYDGPNGTTLDDIITRGTLGATGVDTTKPVHVKLEMTAEEELKIWINDQEVSYSMDPAKVDGFKERYEAGYCGFMTWSTDAIFANPTVDGTTILENVKGQSMTTRTSYELAKLNGNNRAVSNTKTAYFEYSADILFQDGASASMMFGAGSNVYSDLGNADGTTKKFFAVELSRDGDADNANLFVKMFEDGPGAMGEGIIDRQQVATGVDTTKPVTFKVVVTPEKEVELYVNNNKIEYTKGSKYEQFQNAYAGGYLGFVTWNTKAQFSNVSVVNNGTEVTDGFRTNLTGLTFLNGTWNRTDDGLYSNGNDVFAMSDVNVKNFTLEATVTIEGNAAAGLVFRAASNSDPKGEGTYIANIHVEQNSGRMFTFGDGGGDISGRYTIDPDQGTYKMKVVAIGDKINYYVDDVLASSVTNNKFTEGYLGLMTFGGSVTYQDVKYTDLGDDATAPGLTGLEVAGGSLELTPEFDPDVSGYTYFAGYADSVTVTPTAEAGTNLTIAATGPEGEIFAAEAIASGDSKEIPLQVGSNTVSILATKDGVTMGTTITVTKKASSDYMAAEPYRPQFHFSPEINFMNDPNGLIYDPSNGTWHMYFQYSPQLPGMGNQTWGHAQSTDLVTWQEMPVAIPMDDLGAIFSGSAVVDDKNTSGFFDDNEEGDSKLVAIFTHAGGRGQVQSIAYSTDHGVTWTKYEGNPVLDEDDRKYGGDFRDPKVWWQEDPDEPAGGIWLMVVAGGRGQIFSSHDLIDWKFEQALTFADGSELHSECPALFPVNTDEGEKWLYVASSDWYCVGDLVKEEGGWRFVAETGRIESANGGASKMYAGQHYYNDGSGQNRKLMVHWLQDYSAPGTLTDKRWNGVQSIPRVTGLKKIDGTWHMTAYPAKEIESYRSDVIYETENLTVSAEDGNILGGAAGQYYDIEGIFDPGTATEFGFKLRTGNGQETVVKYNAETEQLILDKSKSGPCNTDSFSWTLHPMEDGKVQIRILMDNSVVEVFGNHGDADMADLCFPDPGSIGMEFFVEGGEVTIDELHIWQMKSMFNGEGATSTVPLFLSLSAPDIVDPGEEFTVYASVLPMTATDKSVTWEIGDGLTVVEQTDTYVVLRADAEGDYTVKATSNSGGLEKEITISAEYRIFNTNVADWVSKSGTWYKTGDGMRGQNAGSGDCFYLSENILPNTPFTLTAKVKTLSGQATSLVFGIQDFNNPGASWYCFNIENTSGKFFKNINGAEVIRKDYSLTAEQQESRTFDMKVVYDGNEFIAYLDDKEVARFRDTEYNGGYMGLLTYRSDSVFNDVYLTLNEEITAVDPIADIEVQLGSDVTIEDIIASLPAQVTVTTESGAKVLKDVVWDTSKVDLTQAGTTQITGTVEGTDIPAIINVVVKEEAVIESLTPEEINVSAVEGSTPEEVWNMIDKDVVANYSDGTTANLVVSDWDYSNVNFDEPGNYVATGTLSLDGVPMDLTIPINVIITAEGGQENPGTDKPSIPGSDEDQVGGGDWDWPSGSGSDSTTGSGSGDKENPSSGDSSMIAGALAVLALSAGAAVVLIRKKK